MKGEQTLVYPLTKPTGGLYMGKQLLKRPTVTRMDVGLPVRTAFVTDIHVRKNGLSMIDTVIDMLAELNPELLLLGGDYAEGRDIIVQFFHRLGRILPGVPKYAVLGNNDDYFFDCDHDALRALMRENGVTLLTNEMKRLEIGGKTLEIAGVEDAYLCHPAAENLFSPREDVFRVLLTHAPHTFLLDQCAPDLMLAGHTHGGQVNVLGLTCYTLLRYEYWYRYTHLAGVKKTGRTTALVSNGIGISKFAVRFGARPEIHLFDRERQ